MTTHTFTGPSTTARRKGNCPTCGRQTTRSRTFEHTVNPFNKRSDGEPKTWSEVATDVRTEADAWAPEPAVFEHDACLAARTAPPRAEPIPIPGQTLARSAVYREALASLLASTERLGLPLGSFDIARGFAADAGVRVDFGFLDPGEFLLWARTLGASKVKVEAASSDTTYLRLRADVDGIGWSLSAIVQRRGVGDRLGGAAVEYGRDRNGRKSSFGTVELDALAEGLACMGVSEVRGATGGAA